MTQIKKGEHFFLWLDLFPNIVKCIFYLPKLRQGYDHGGLSSSAGLSHWVKYWLKTVIWQKSCRPKSGTPILRKKKPEENSTTSHRAFNIVVLFESILVYFATIGSYVITILMYFATIQAHFVIIRCYFIAILCYWGLFGVCLDESRLPHSCL